MRQGGNRLNEPSPGPDQVDERGNQADAAKKRSDLANRLAAGVAAWLMDLALRDLETFVNEGALQLKVCELVKAFGLTPKSEMQLPWEDKSQQAVDIGLLSAGGDQQSTWYGAIELKFVNNTNPSEYRKPLVQDAVRLGLLRLQGPRYRFLLLSGTHDGVDRLLRRGDNPSGLHQVFPLETTESPKRPNKNQLAELDALDEKRIPMESVGDTYHLKIELLAHIPVKFVEKARAEVYLWNCEG